MELEPSKRLPIYEPIGKTVQRIIDELDTKNGEPELKTGLEVFDKGIFGLHKSQLTILAARAGNGKTSMACNAAFELAVRGHSVAFVSLEMGREQIVSKMFCAHSKVDSFKFLIGRVSAEEKNRLYDFKKLVETLPIKIVDDYCFTQQEMYTLIEHLEFRPEALIIDHLQHIRATDAIRRSERENLSEYLRYLKEIAMRHKIAVLCLSQVNREGDEMPTLKTLKGTGALEEMADHVILLHLEKPKDDSPYISAHAQVAKNRFGPTGKFDLMFDGPYGSFSK